MLVCLSDQYHRGQVAVFLVGDILPPLFGPLYPGHQGILPRIQVLDPASRRGLHIIQGLVLIINHQVQPACLELPDDSGNIPVIHFKVPFCAAHMPFGQHPDDLRHPAQVDSRQGPDR